MLRVADVDCVFQSPTSALSARNPAASAPTNTKAAPATIHLIFLNEMLIVVSFQLKKLLSAHHLRQGNGRHSVNDLSIYVEVFLRLTVPSFFAREKLPAVQGDSLVC